MSVFKTTFSRALRVIPTNNAVIPSPSLITTKKNTAVAGNQLISSSGNFITLNVAVGDVVYNVTDGTAATVTSVVSSSVLQINADIFLATNKTYYIYQQSPQSGLGNTGCFLYIGGAGNVSVITIGGDVVTFEGVIAGTVLPVQVLTLKETGTTATLINALW